MSSKCIEELTQQGIAFKMIALSHSVHSVKDVQDACNCPVSEVIKTLLFIGNTPIVVLLPGDKKADMEKIKKLLHESSLRMATKEEVLALTGYSVGSVSPFGVLQEIRQIADISMELLDSLVLGSGQSDALIQLTQPEFAKVFRGIFAAISYE